MNNSTVGASILNIITESLYDKPIVIFREYIQNSADSLKSKCKSSNACSLFSSVWSTDNDLFFLDNGTGINPDDFLSKMQSIAFSGKDKETSIGYKGIGRLSGISYCKKLRFINIIDFNKELFQEYEIDCVLYNNIQKSQKYNETSFVSLMSQIGTLKTNVSSEEVKQFINNRIPDKSAIESGFLVILEDISSVLRIVINDKNFENSLCWLLPVPFKKELLNTGNPTDELFEWLSSEPSIDGSNIIAAQSYTIYFNGKQLYRPLTANMLRTYVCKCNFEKYAVCVQSFSSEKIEIDQKNPFSGIRIYIDNMLLCDETELIPALRQYGLTTHTSNELIQSVRGMGVIIYIVDKINISANARRTFIELTDTDSLRFLELAANLVENIYSTRYALSRYSNALKKEVSSESNIEELRQKALTHLKLLASDEIVVTTIDKPSKQDYLSLSTIDQKRAIKTKLTKGMNEYIKTYLNQTDSFNVDTCVDDFKTWLLANLF